MDGNDKREQSEFNSSVSYLNRINTEFSMAVESSIMLEPHTWFYAILAIYRELSTEMKEEEIKTFKDMKRKINEMLDKQSRRNDGQSQTINSDLYDALEDFEIKLRKIFKDSGLQQKVQDAASNALR